MNGNWLLGVRIPLFGLLVSLLGCVVVPAIPETITYRFEIDGTLDGKNFSFRQFSRCSSSATATLSGADGRFHSQWKNEGAGTFAAKIKDSAYVVYKIPPCIPFEKKRELQRNYYGIGIIDSVDEPTTLTPFRGDKAPANNLPNLSNLRLEATDAFNAEIGPQGENKEFKDFLNKRILAFHRVRVRIIPFDQIAIEPKGVEYFTNTETLNLAPNPKLYNFSEGRLFRDRSDDDVEIRKRLSKFGEIELGFDGSFFLMPSAARPTAQSSRYHRAVNSDKANANGYVYDAIVKYKGETISIKDKREIYDPEIKSVVFFWHEIVIIRN